MNDMHSTLESMFCTSDSLDGNDSRKNGREQETGVNVINGILSSPVAPCVRLLNTNTPDDAAVCAQEKPLYFLPASILSSAPVTFAVWTITPPRNYVFLASWFRRIRG